jgi:hypothetical protein
MVSFSHNFQPSLGAELAFTLIYYHPLRATSSKALDMVLIAFTFRKIKENTSPMDVWSLDWENPRYDAPLDILILYWRRT